LALHKPPLEIPFVDTETGFVTEPWAKWLIINYRDKANRVEDGTENNIVTLDSDGQPQDGSLSLPTGSVVGTTATQTLTNKTLTAPTIADFTSMQHNHKSAAAGGDYPFADMVLAATQTDAVVTHSLTDASETVDRSELEGMLDAIGTIINALIDKLQTAKLMT